MLVRLDRSRRDRSLERNNAERDGDVINIVIGVLSRPTIKDRVKERSRPVPKVIQSQLDSRRGAYEE
jgi:hypothetical protein